MARARSPEKRSAILEAAIHEIAESGLGAATAAIAERAGVASGTLFTYFPTKDELLNELYLELKTEVYARLLAEFPHDGSLKQRSHHIWTTYLDWALESPARRKVSAQLNLSNLMTAATRAQVAIDRGAIDATMKELDAREPLSTLPAGFASAMMSAMQDATMEFVARHPKKRKETIEQAFAVFWRAVR